MKKLILITLLIMIVIFTAMVIFAPVKIGNIVYQSMTSIETKIYGLEETTVDIGEMKMHLLQNHNKTRPTILMLHGFSADKINWIRFAKHLDNDFNLVIPDMAGHGETGFNNNWDYNTPAQAARLVKLLNKLEIDKAHVIGNSMGGSIAAQFAKNHPNRILTLAMIDPAGVIAPELGDMDKQLIQGRNPFLINSQQDFEIFYKMTMSEPPWIPGFVLQAIADKYIKRRTELNQMWLEFHGKDLLDNELDQIKTRTLLIWGEEDRLLDVSSVKIWRRIADIEVEIYPKIGHLAMLEIPKQSAERYLSFLEKNK